MCEGLLPERYLDTCLTYRPLEMMTMSFGSKRPATGGSQSKGWHSWPSLNTNSLPRRFLLKDNTRYLWLKASRCPLIISSSGLSQSDREGNVTWVAFLHCSGLYDDKSSGSAPCDILLTISWASAPARNLVSRPAWGSVLYFGPMIWREYRNADDLSNKATYDAV